MTDQLDLSIDSSRLEESIDKFAATADRIADQLIAARKQNRELLAALKECVENFNWSRLAMDGESRALSGVLVDEYRKVIARAEGAR
jgi:hypothetical protein